MIGSPAILGRDGSSISTVSRQVAKVVAPVHVVETVRTKNVQWLERPIQMRFAIVQRFRMICEVPFHFRDDSRRFAD